MGAEQSWPYGRKDRLERSAVMPKGEYSYVAKSYAGLPTNISCCPNRAW
jgi:hypothetical protein